jgi:hypothetical protein
LNHFTNPDFWFRYRRLPLEIRELADKNFELLKADPRHPSLRLKKIGVLWPCVLADVIAPWRRSATRGWFGSGLAGTTPTRNF